MVARLIKSPLPGENCLFERITPQDAEPLGPGPPPPPPPPPLPLPPPLPRPSNPPTGVRRRTGVYRGLFERLSARLPHMAMVWPDLPPPVPYCSLLFTFGNMQMCLPYKTYGGKYTIR